MNKKMLRSILCIVLALTLVVALAACGSQKKAEEAAEELDAAVEELDEAIDEMGEELDAAAAVNYDTVYCGESESGVQAYFLVDSTTGDSCLAFVDENPLTVVGLGTDNGDGTYTIADNATGEECTFQCVAGTDAEGADCLTISLDGETGYVLYPAEDAAAVVGGLVEAGIMIY